MEFPWVYYLLRHSLRIIHRGVFREGEVVGDVFVIRQPVVCPYQPIGTDGHLQRKNHLNAKVTPAFSLLSNRNVLLLLLPGFSYEFGPYQYI